MAIPAMEVKLQAWGEWSAKRENGALGYKAVSLTRLMGVPGGLSDGIPHDVDDEMMAVDRAVCRLPSYLRETMVEYYQRIGSTADHAKRLGIARETLWRRIEGAHVLIQNTLWDREHEKKLKRTLDVTQHKVYK